MKYLPLKTLKYNLDGDVQQYEDEYKKRLNSYGTYSTNLYPFLMKRGSFETSKYQIFIMNLPDITIETERIINKSRYIQKLSDELPQIAGRQFFFETLSNEIISSNDIEGVKSTRREVNRAIRAVNENSKAVRMSSTVKMYVDVFDDNYLSIKKLSDIKDIYKQLLDGEIEEDDLLDGEFFRKDQVYIQGNKIDQVVHVAPVGEDELKRRMTEWIRFINDNDVPFMIKALIGHYFFENTHPFYDGNGRTGRYILSMYLSRKLDKYTGISFSQAVHATKSKYYKAFEKTGDYENRAEGTFFVMDLLDLISQSQNIIIEALESRIDSFKKVTRKINSQYPRTMSENYVLFLLAQSRMFNDSIESGLLDKDVKKLAEHSEFSVRSVSEAIKKLEEDGFIKKVRGKPIQHVISDDYID